MSEPFQEIEESEFAKLPRWAGAAFAARCARRILPVLQATRLAGRDAVERVLDRIDECIRTAVALSERDIFDLIDEVDDLEVSYRRNDDLHQVACHVLCSAKSAAFCAIEYEDIGKNAFSSYRNAAQGSCFAASRDPDEAIVNSEVTYAQMFDDFEALTNRLAKSPIEDESPFDVKNLGVMWPTSTPTWARGNSEWDSMK